jgi:S-formylglutathione hydrolase FrmB
MSKAHIVRRVLAYTSLLVVTACGSVGGISIIAPDIEADQSGRLFVVFTKADEEQSEVIFSRTDDDQPRFQIGWPIDRTSAAPFFAMDVENWDGTALSFNSAASYPIANVNDLPVGVWNVQALLDSNSVLADLNSPGNLYSQTQEIEISGGPLSLQLQLTEVIEPEMLPQDTELLKFVKVRSQLLSDFYQQDIYLRASVLLPAGYQEGADIQYPVLYQVGGLSDRYTRSINLLAEDDFAAYWMAEDTPAAVMVFLDGESPWGDSYQVNSEISGPYADANFEELFTYLEQNFPIANQAQSRFVSGCSTAGWVSLALQVFYPDYFNGAYSFSPDSPSFSAFQLVDLYEDSHAFVNDYGVLRPSMRQTNGEPMFGIGDEIQVESAMGIQGSFLNSRQQWASWNVIYGQLDAEGNPIPVWDQETGEIDKAAVEGWSKWDIDKHLTENWQTLGPKLEGKLNFWMGDMDNFYLTPGLRILEQSLSEQTNPASDADFTWAPYKGHCEIDNQTYYFDVIEKMSERASL